MFKKSTQENYIEPHRLGKERKKGRHVFQKKKLTNIKENGIFQKNSPPTRKQRTNPKKRKLVMVSLRICKRTDRIPNQFSFSLRETNRIEL